MSTKAQTTVFPSTVLVVDDEDVILHVMKKLLEGRGLTVITSRSGEEAEALLKTQGFGCLLTDKNMPGTDGITLIRTTRKLQPYCACLVMTGYASTDSAVEALRLGAIDYLRKPFEDLDIVALKVEAAIKHQRALCERDLLIERVGKLQKSVQDNQIELENAKDELGKAVAATPVSPPPVAIPQPRSATPGDDRRWRDLQQKQAHAIDVIEQARELLNGRIFQDTIAVADSLLQGAVCSLKDGINVLKEP